jgi:hypothetical protein
LAFRQYQEKSVLDSFALETENEIENAKAKIQKTRFDYNLNPCKIWQVWKLTNEGGARKNAQRHRQLS